MTMKRLVPVALCLLVFAGGCGGDCESTCEDEKACRGSDRRSVDCEAFCDDLEARSEATGCQDEFDSLVDCQAGRADVCSDVGCESEEKAFESCSVAYCREHPDDATHCSV